MRLLAALAAATAIAGCNGDDGPEPERRDPFTKIEQDFERSRGTLRAAPRWERVAAASGEDAGRLVVGIAEDAIQWRVRWRCDTGRLHVRVSPRPSGPSEAEGRCPGRGDEAFIGSGQRRLSVDAPGRWRLIVEQQVETPLAEPALDGAEELARGEFVSVERPSRGAAIVSRLRSGRLALRLEDFRTSANSDLFVWLSRARAPRTTRQALARPHRVLAPLKATAGDQNYLLPRGVTRGEFRSIVIWCVPIRIAYAAAPLRSRGSATNSS